MAETAASDDHKRQVRANFNTLAATYDSLRYVQDAARRLVELAVLHAGARVLDVVAAGGGVAMAVARSCRRQDDGGVWIWPLRCWRMPSKSAWRLACPMLRSRRGMQSGWTSQTNVSTWCSVPQPSSRSPTCPPRSGSGGVSSSPVATWGFQVLGQPFCSHSGICGTRGYGSMGPRCPRCQ